MPHQYRNNHYVPIWYQKRFLLPNQKNKELYYLNLKPETFTDGRGMVHSKKPIRRWGCKYCFAEKDLYTTWLESEYSTDIEQVFFGDIDNKGRRAINYFSQFEHPSADSEAFQDMIMYLSTQKLRTPKGLGWLSDQSKVRSSNLVLPLMIQYRQLFCAIWTECIWQIANADLSETKFIISDHPVTVYNRRCGPRSQWCRSYNDPDVRYHGTHAFFPLSSDKILILTNRSWARNPYQSEIKLRPNPTMLRGAIMKFNEIQIKRCLSEDEVRTINFIIKSRALRYIAAQKEEWLYPERFVSKSQWYEYGHGYLFMPDPRPLHVGGELMWGNGKGSYGAQDEYGRKPWDPNYNKETNTFSEAASLSKFQGEFARLFGPYRRGRSFSHMVLDDEKDSESFHQYHLGLERKNKRKRK